MQVSELLRQMPGSLEPAKVLILPIKVNTVAAENLGNRRKDLNMPLRHLLPLLVVFCSLPALAAKGYHLWYDKDGQAVYSQFAPADGGQSQIVKPPPPPAESPEEARQHLQQRLQQFEDNREDEELAAEKTAAANTEASQQRQRCETARKNLTLLNGRPRQLFQTPDGIRRLTEEERQAKRDEMQKVIDTDCK